MLQQLLVSLTPTETQVVSQTTPIRSIPETWIPYRLAEDAFVTLTIYDLNGQVVRTIDVGHQTAAFYESRSQAIYWDGRNQIGEHGSKRCLLLSPIRRRLFRHAQNADSQVALRVLYT